LKSKKISFQKHRLTVSPIYEVCERILALIKDCSEVLTSGTGLMEAQNLILTAKHEFDDFSNLYGYDT